MFQNIHVDLFTGKRDNGDFLLGFGHRTRCLSSKDQAEPESDKQQQPFPQPTITDEPTASI